MTVDIAPKLNQNTAGSFMPEADPSKPWFVPVSTPTGFSPQYSINWDLAKNLDPNALGSPNGQNAISGPANDPGWDAYIAAKRTSLGLPNTGITTTPTTPTNPTPNLPTIPTGITTGTSGTSPVSNYSMDVWDYLKDFQMPSTFAAPDTDAPKVGWGV
jgi:hypothetical protein